MTGRLNRYEIHTCGLRTDGTVACWGLNLDEQASPPGGIFAQVSAGGDHTCGLQTDGTLDCWGRNDDGQAPRVTVNPASLPDGQGGVFYSQSLSASGGTAPHSFAVVAGSLPSGLSLSTGGVLSGTPTSGGAYTFTIQATDVNFVGGERVYTVTVFTELHLPLVLKNTSAATKGTDSVDPDLGS